MKQRKLLIDGKKIRMESPAGGKNLSETVREVIWHHLPEDRIVDEIRVDGELVCKNGEYQKNIDDCQGESIEVVTIPLDEVLRESVRTLVSHLSQVARLFSEIGRALRKGMVDDVFGGDGVYRDRGGAYVQGIEAMVAAQVLVDQIRGASGTSDHRAGNLLLVEDETRFEELLKSMLLAQESQDWILLADLVEYELVPVFEKGLASAEQYYQNAFAGAA